MQTTECEQLYSLRNWPIGTEQSIQMAGVRSPSLLAVKLAVRVKGPV